MEIRQLRHFVAVVECGNLSAAARKVFISQPALTRSIKNLEETVGSTLLERRARGTVPTPAGELFFHHARMILSDCQRARDDLRTLKSGITGNVSLGIGAMFSTHIIDSVVMRIAAELPNLNLNVTEGYFEDLVSQLEAGRVDAIFSTFPRAVPQESLVLEPLIEIRAIIAAGASHPLARRRNLALADLRDQRWVIVNQPHSLRQHEQMFASADLAVPPTTFRSNSLSMIKSLVERGRFLTYLPEHVVAEEVKRGSIRRLDVAMEPVLRKAGLIYLQRPFQPNAVARVMEMLREECARAAE
jgi:LysR family transcriptional regulator of gallate degradation